MLAGTLKRPQTAVNDTKEMIALAASVLANARSEAAPFRHWLFDGALPEALCRAAVALPIAPPDAYDTQGKRDSHNEVRRFFSPDMQALHAPMRDIAEIFQSEPVIRAIEKTCSIQCKGSYLRIEYCQDREGFWLEPHMDIKEKLMTMQIYLNTDADAATLGTDVYDAGKKHFGRAPGNLGQGMIFIPKEPNSWHGFEKRPIKSVRRSLIINYVTDDWRARHELSFPNQPIPF